MWVEEKVDHDEHWTKPHDKGGLTCRGGGKREKPGRGSPFRGFEKINFILGGKRFGNPQTSI